MSYSLLEDSQLGHTCFTRLKAHLHPLGSRATIQFKRHLDLDQLVFGQGPPYRDELKRSTALDQIGRFGIWKRGLFFPRAQSATAHGTLANETNLSRATLWLQHPSSSPTLPARCPFLSAPLMLFVTRPQRSRWFLHSSPDSSRDRSASIVARCKNKSAGGSLQGSCCADPSQSACKASRAQ